MSIAREHVKWKKDLNRWLSDHKKWQKNNKKVLQALQNLQQAVKRHGTEVKAFVEKVDRNKKIMAKKQHTSALHKKLKKDNIKHGQHHKIHSKSNNQIIQITKNIERAVKSFNHR